MTVTKDELLELELGFWNATRNPDYYREHMAPDGLAVFGMGVMGKTAAIGSTSSPEAGDWADVHLDDVRLLELTEVCAALVYHGSATRAGVPYAANASSVYVRRDGEWKLALHQQSPTEPDA
jgi:hypothetical protein